mgnify:CR=1 FL=1
MRIEQDHDRLHASDVAQLESLSDLIPAAPHLIARGRGPRHPAPSTPVHYASLSIPAMSRRGTEPALQPGQGRRTGGERLVEQRQLVTVHPDGIDRKK